MHNRWAAMSSGADDEIDTSSSETSAFNIYHTEVVKHDATNSIQMANGDLVRQPPPAQQQQDQHRLEADDDHALDQFALLKPDYEIMEQMIQDDSINVNVGSPKLPTPPVFSLHIVEFDPVNRINQARVINDLPFSRIPSLVQQNKSFTDVTFIVGPPQHSKKYVGHRVLLAMTSPGK